VASVVRTLPVGAVFAAVPTYNHPLLLNGRNVVEGYDGHLQSHGIHYEKQQAMLQSLLEGEPDWRQTAQELHVRYIFWGKREEESYPDSAVPWRDECRKIAEGSWGQFTIWTRQSPGKRRRQRRERLLGSRLDLVQDDGSFSHDFATNQCFHRELKKAPHPPDFSACNEISSRGRAGLKNFIIFTAERR